MSKYGPGKKYVRESSAVVSSDNIKLNKLKFTPLKTFVDKILKNDDRNKGRSMKDYK